MNFNVLYAVHDIVLFAVTSPPPVPNELPADTAAATRNCAHHPRHGPKTCHVICYFQTQYYIQYLHSSKAACLLQQRTQVKTAL